MQYVLVNPKTGSIELLHPDSFVVPIAPLPGFSWDDDFFLNAADNPHLEVIPVIETLEASLESTEH